MSIGKDNRREILKKILAGTLAADSVTLELLRTKGTATILIVVQHDSGLYSIGEEPGITEEQMKERVKGTVHVIVDEETAHLGSAII